MKKNKKSLQNNGTLSYTQQLKQDRKVKEFWKSMGVSPDEEGFQAYVRHVKFRSGDVSDEELEMLTDKIKMIDMLDIYEAPITATGISHLTKTQFIKELRLKYCTEITNDSIPLLNKIKGLELLYLGGTQVTVDAIHGLKDLNTLKSLFLSSDLEYEEAKTILIPMRDVLPGCEFIIDHKVIYFDEE